MIINGKDDQKQLDSGGTQKIPLKVNDKGIIKKKYNPLTIKKVRGSLEKLFLFILLVLLFELLADGWRCLVCKVAGFLPCKEIMSLDGFA